MSNPRAGQCYKLTHTRNHTHQQIICSLRIQVKTVVQRQSCNVTGRIKCWMFTAGGPNAASSHVSHSDSIQHPLTNRMAIAIGRMTLTVICAVFLVVKQSWGTLVVLIIDHCQRLWNLERQIRKESAL
ncbi:hypothetical protein T01_4832 [Trichinella spiralis]|uniref:Uncharacterized protein n=1 Tax=Trichinella spiralis TaxID=6334 RepID=A0A0V1AR96_TRISP|nr:hypothetical protein T01_4832 [Trichinella spiralis]